MIRGTWLRGDQSTAKVIGVVPTTCNPLYVSLSQSANMHFPEQLWHVMFTAGSACFWCNKSADNGQTNRWGRHCLPSGWVLQATWWKGRNRLGHRAYESVVSCTLKSLQSQMPQVAPHVVACSLNSRASCNFRDDLFHASQDGLWNPELVPICFLWNKDDMILREFDLIELNS